MAKVDNITTIGTTEGSTEADRRWASAEQFAAQIREENEAQRKAIEVLYGCTPREFASRYLVRLRYLLSMLPHDQNALQPNVQGDLIWMAHDLARLVEIAVDRIPEMVGEGGTK